MSLDKSRLQAALIDAFDMGMNDPNWTKEQAAEALAEAIDQFVRDAEVVNIAMDVFNLGGAPIGTGSQTGVGALQ